MRLVSTFSNEKYDMLLSSIFMFKTKLYLKE